MKSIFEWIKKKLALNSCNYFERHVLKLCKFYAVRYRRYNKSNSKRDPDDAYAVKRREFVYIPEITNEINYAIALHEIGHIMTGSKGLYSSEFLAWQWAYEHAFLWSDTMDRFKNECLASYEKFAQENNLKHSIPNSIKKAHVFMKF